MENELLEALLRMNLAAAAAVLAILAARGVMRRLFGARAAYALWLIAPAAAFAVLLPPRAASFRAPATPVAAYLPFESAGEPSPLRIAPAPRENAAATVETASFGLSPSKEHGAGYLAVWLGGAVVYALLLLWRQQRFMRRLGALRRESGPLFRAENAGVGPAMVGVFRPRIILPSDFEARFDAEERRLILAHERMHLSAGDGLANFVVAAAQALCWFNPLAHVAARVIREDQELACDAAVMARFPGARRVYAEALVKSQGLACAVPIGASWPARPERPLVTRIANLSFIATGRRKAAGGLLVAALAIAAGAAAWAGQPPVRSEPAEEPAAGVVQAASLAAENVNAQPAPDRERSEAVDVREIAAVVTVIPEDRADVAVTIAGGTPRLPKPALYVEEGVLVVDGGLDLEKNPCKERFDGAGAAKVPGKGSFRPADLPRVTIRTPRRVDVRIGGVTVAEIGPSAGGRIDNVGCGDMRIAAAGGELEAGLYGFGDVSVADVAGPLTAKLYGIGDMQLGRSREGRFILFGVGAMNAGDVDGPAEIHLQGAGDIRVGKVEGGARIRLPGAGAVAMGALKGPLSIETGGAGDISIASLNGPRATIESWGAGDVMIGGGAVDVFDAEFSGGSGATFKGRAGVVRAEFMSGSGDLVIASAGRVEENRDRYASGRVRIGE